MKVPPVSLMVFVKSVILDPNKIEVTVNVGAPKRHYLGTFSKHKNDGAETKLSNSFYANIL